MKERRTSSAASRSPRSAGSVIAILRLRSVQRIDALVDPAQRLQVAVTAGLQPLLRGNARLAVRESRAEGFDLFLPAGKQGRPVLGRLDAGNAVGSIGEAHVLHLAR